MTSPSNTPTPKTFPEVLDEILTPFHNRYCQSGQRWFKGQTEPFPCDCHIVEARQAIQEAILRDVVGENFVEVTEYDRAINGYLDIQRKRTKGETNE